jgi:hypothetical protein
MVMILAMSGQNRREIGKDRFKARWRIKKLKFGMQLEDKYASP